MNARIDMWLSVVPNEKEYAALAHVHAERTAALMQMVGDVVGDGETPDEMGGWTGEELPVLDGDVPAQMLYSFVHQKCGLYAVERAKRTPDDDWSHVTKLKVHSDGPTGEKRGQYYYQDGVTRWCRYRLPLVLDLDGKPWTLSRTVDDKELTATVEASLSVQMV